MRRVVLYLYARLLMALAARDRRRIDWLLAHPGDDDPRWSLHYARAHKRFARRRCTAEKLFRKLGMQP